MERRVLNNYQIEIVLAIGEGKLRASELRAAVGFSENILLREVRKLVDADIVRVDRGYTGTNPNIRYHTLTPLGLDVLRALQRLVAVLERGEAR